MSETTETNKVEATETQTHKKEVQHTSETTAENRWLVRLEELLKVKNLDDLRTELTKLAGEIQTEIQSFDLNSHLSPTAKARLKALEQNYTQVTRAITKAQKQFDREFNKSLRLLKKTRQDVEKQVRDVTTKVAKHRTNLLKASKSITSKIKKTASRARKPAKSARKTKKA
jgi:uncharacterized phage infection (PIP) family protein YhgE